MRATIQSSTRDHVFATWQHLILVLWRGNATVEAVREGQRILEEHAKAWPDGILILTVVEDGAPMPDGPARDALGKLLQSGAGHTRKSAVVYEGDGFRAAAVFSKPPFPHEIFGHVSEAAGFLASDAGHGVTGNQLANIVSDVRQRHLQSLTTSPG